MTLVLAVFRRPEMLKALLSERIRPFEPGSEPTSPAYGDRVIPLIQIPEDLCPWRDADVKAWRSLSKVPKLSARAAQAIVRVLLSTVVEPGLSLEDPGDIVYGGKAVDLRPSLCHWMGEQRLIAAIGADERPESSELPQWHWTHRQEIADLPDRFRYYFLWRLSLRPWHEVELMAAMFHGLGLSEDLSLTKAVARLSAATKGDSLLWWCDAIAEAAGLRRAGLIEYVLAHGVQEARPDAECQQLLQEGSWQEISDSLQRIAAAEEG